MVVVAGTVVVVDEDGLVVVEAGDPQAPRMTAASTNHTNNGNRIPLLDTFPSL